MTTGFTRRTIQLPTGLPEQRPPNRHRKRNLYITLGVVAVLAAATATIIWPVGRDKPPASSATSAASAHATPKPSAPPKPFDPSIDASLPTHRVVAFYAVPGAPATGPAYTLSTSMLSRLRAQGAVYEKLDPAHPVALGIDLVVSVPDRFKGRSGTYSHYVDSATIDRY